MLRLALSTFLAGCLLTSMGLAEGNIYSPSNARYGTPWSWGSSIARYDEKTNTFVTVFTDTTLIFWEHNIRVKPGSAELIYALAKLNKKFVDERGAGFDRYVLLLLTPKGRILQRVDNVVIFDWSKTGDSVVYGTGKLYSDKDVLVSDHLWMVNYKTKKKKDLGPSNATGVAWTAWDDAIYTKERTGVYQYSSAGIRKGKADLLDINFSYDGRYYFTSRGGDTVKIYERASNAEVKLENLSPAVDPNLVTWVPFNNSLIVGDHTFKKVIIDVQKKSSINISGLILGYDSADKSIYILKNPARGKDRRVSQTLQVEKIHLKD